MIWLLTIVFTILIIWTCISLFVIAHDEVEFTDIDLMGNGLLITIAQIYWLGFFALICIGVVVIVAYAISKSVICHAKNNDYPGCEVVETKENK